MSENNNLEFGQVVTAVVTPFDQDLAIDFQAYANVLEHLIDTGSSAVVVSGTTGESPTLRSSEKFELLKFTLKQVKGRIKVVFGAGTNDTKKSIELSKQACSIGADGLLVVAPYYNKPNQSGLIAHFSAIANSVNLPIIIYNIPGRSGITIENQTILELNKTCSNIQYLKDSTGNLNKANELDLNKNEGLKVYSGDDEFTLAFLRLGASGVISVASHLIGRQINNLINAYFNQDLNSAKAIHKKCLPLFKNLFIEPNPVCVKFALAQIGLIKPYVRLPLTQLAPESKKIITETMMQFTELKSLNKC